MANTTLGLLTRCPLVASIDTINDVEEMLQSRYPELCPFLHVQLMPQVRSVLLRFVLVFAADGCPSFHKIGFLISLDHHPSWQQRQHIVPDDFSFAFVDGPVSGVSPIR
jgi:hypothetical protein